MKNIMRVRTVGVVWDFCNAGRNTADIDAALEKAKELLAVGVPVHMEFLTVLGESAQERELRELVAEKETLRNDLDACRNTLARVERRAKRATTAKK